MIPCLAFAGGLRAGQAELSQVAREPAIELPKFEVVDTRILPKPEAWRYAEVPGFEILSRISTSQTKRFTQDFMLLQEVIRTIMPTLVDDRAGVPTALVLAGRGRGLEEFLPTAQADDVMRLNSLFFENTERTAIVVDFALAELELADSERIESDPYRAFYAEYFRYLIRRKLGRTSPAWLEEGLVQIFAGIDFNRKWINFGLIGDGFGGSKPGDFNQLLVRRGLMPIGRMLTAESPDPDWPMWRTQCYAFVHMCIYGNARRYQKGFLQFVTRLGSEPLTEDLFKQCFKVSYKDMGIELRGYLEFTYHTAVQFRAKKGQQLPEPPAVAIREATPAEVGRIKGEVLRMGGHEEAAHLSLIAPYIRGDKDPRLLAAIGLDELAGGNTERAQKFLEAALQAKAVRPRAYLELGRLRYKSALAAAGSAGVITPSQFNTVLEPLQIAVKQPPPLLAVYALLAEAWLHSTVRPDREQMTMLENGVNAFPRQADLLASVTILASRSGFPEDARTLAARGREIFARDPLQKERFILLSDAVTRDGASASAQKK